MNEPVSDTHQYNLRFIIKTSELPGRWQGDQARYVGTRKNLFGLRRTTVAHNLHVKSQNFY